MRKVVFKGDSITDAKRNRTFVDDLGKGYVRNIHDVFCASNPTSYLEFLNKGIGGNRLVDLKERWNQDCIQENPDILSIMIGINDTWRAFDSGLATLTEAFRDDYRYIIETALENRFDLKLVLCEPFLLMYPDDRKLWLKVCEGGCK